MKDRRSVAAAVLAVASASLLAPIPAAAQTSSPSGRVVFASQADGDWDIWTMDPDGTDLVNLVEDGTDGPHDHQPSWSPDGRRIVFQSTRGPGDDGDIYVMDADGGNVVAVTANTDSDFQPDWSPDGTRIVFAGERESESPDGTDDSDIYVIDADGSNEHNLTDPFEAQPGQYEWYDKDPDWSPVAEEIVFSSARVIDGSVSDGAFWRIVRMRSDGSGQTILSDPNDPGTDPWPDETPNHDEMPKWSPDGSWVVFATHQQPEQQWDIQIVRGNGADQQNVLPDEDWEDVFPTWAPSGTEILFTSNRTGDHTRAIYSLDVSVNVADAQVQQRALVSAAVTTVEPVGGVGRAQDPDVFGRLPCTIRGTRDAETLEGTPQRDVICAGGGGDVVSTGRGRDVVYAGPGDDEVAGGLRSDLLFGNAGADRLDGGGGLDLCVDAPNTIRVRCD